MSHIDGHVEDFNANSLFYKSFQLSLPSKKASPYNPIKSTMPFGVVKLIIKKKDYYLPFINTCRAPLKHGQEIGFHLFLTSFDPEIKKYRAYAYDVINLEDHESTEATAIPILKAKYKKQYGKMENYTSDQISVLLNDKKFKGKDPLREVIRQTSDYVLTSSFKILYCDEKGNFLGKENDHDAAVKANILKKVHLSEVPIK